MLYVIILIFLEDNPCLKRKHHIICWIWSLNTESRLQHLSIPNGCREKGAELALLLYSSTSGNQSPLIPLFMLEGVLQA